MTDGQGTTAVAGLPSWMEQLSFDANGLIPAIAQDKDTGMVLMVAWMNAAAVQETFHSRRAVYYSRSRQRLWRKGEESGHYQQVHDMLLDCDGDVLLLQVSQIGGIACHTGRKRCFFRSLDLAAASAGKTPSWLVLDPVLKDPADIYPQEHHEQNR